MYLNVAKILNGQKDAKSTYFKEQNPFVFKLILSSEDTKAASIWHESSFEVLEGAQRAKGRFESGSLPLKNGYKFQQDGCLDHLASTRCQTISLQDLVQPRPQAGMQIKMRLKSRMPLALNLASMLLQLQGTPWLAISCSKRAIKLLKRAPAAQTAMTTTSFAPAAGQEATALPSVPEDIDDEHPLVSQKISTSSQHAHRVPSIPQKDALLVLRIMLLELWHEPAIEIYYPTSPMGHSGAPIPIEYWGRFMLASMWLEEPNDQPLPLYYIAISQCVKCFFAGPLPLPDWDGCELSQGSL